MITMTDTDTAPVFPVPTSLSPSRVSSFTSCPMQFRFSSIEKLPEPPGVATTRGTIVHQTGTVWSPNCSPEAVTGWKTSR